MLFDLFYKNPKIQQNVVEENIELKKLISDPLLFKLQCIICTNTFNSTEHHHCVLRNNQKLIIKTSSK